MSCFPKIKHCFGNHIKSVHSLDDEEENLDYLLDPRFVRASSFHDFCVEFLEKSFEYLSIEIYCNQINDVESNAIYPPEIRNLLRE